MTLINLEDVQKILLKYKPNIEPLDVYFYSELMQWINSLTTINPEAILKDMIEEIDCYIKAAKKDKTLVWENVYKFQKLIIEEALSRITK